MTLTKKFSIIVILLLAFTTVFAQSGKTHSKMSKAATTYACTECEMAAMKPMKCSMCKKDMAKIDGKVMYHCAHCNKDMAMGGKCPTCKGMTTKMVMTYACDHCHTTAKMAGKCPKCKMSMKKHMMKVQG